jgi:hypothetical protein
MSWPHHAAMIVLFFKASPDAADDEPADALPEKMRVILLSHVKEAKTPEEKERAEGAPAAFSNAGPAPRSREKDRVEAAPCHEQ